MLYSTPYKKWINGPALTTAQFPIGVWFQSTSNAAKWKAAGCNMYVSPSNGYGSSDLAALAAQGMGLVLRQNAATLALSQSDPNARTIWGWNLVQDEPDNDHLLTGAPTWTPQDVIQQAAITRAADASRPVYGNFSMGLGDPQWWGRGAGYPGDDAYYGVALPACDLPSGDIFPLTGLGLSGFVTPVDGRPYMYMQGDAVKAAQKYGGGRPSWHQLECTHIGNSGAFISGTINVTTGSGGLAANTYYYRVTGISVWGESAGSAEVSATVGAGSSITLSWPANASATGGFKIYRSTSSGQEVLLKTLGSGFTGYTDSGTDTPGTTPYPTAENSRPLPSQQQMRGQAWMVIVNGGGGIIWFVHEWDYGQRNLLSDSAPLLANTTTGPATANWPNQLAAITSVNGEITSLAQVINSAGRLSGTSSAFGIRVDYTTRWLGRTGYLFAVGMANSANQSGSFTVPGLKAGTPVTVINESRTVTASANGFTDTFVNPYDTHLYSFPLGSSRVRMAIAT